MRCFTPRWSCSIRLFRYFDERSFVSAAASHRLSARAPHGEMQRSRSSVIVCGARCWLLIALRKNALVAATSRLALSLSQPSCRPIDGTVEVEPLASDLDLCLVDSP